MSEEFAIEALKAATREWVEGSEAVRRWREEHIAFWWPESQEAPAEPKPVTREALDEVEKLQLAEQKAHEKWRRINRGLLGVS